jgi:hypothetical protein
LAAILITMIATFLLGWCCLLVVWGIETVFGAAGPFESLTILGTLTAFSVLFSWIGHILGAVVLQLLHARKIAGWASVMLAGLGVGLVVGGLISLPIAILYAPVLAVFQAWVLRQISRYRVQ